MEPADRSTSLDSGKPFHSLLHRSRTPALDIDDLKLPSPLHGGDFIGICLMKNVPCDHHLDGVV